jgi:23S rRNA pseudouridine1911/1915/1917 synthase
MNAPAEILFEDNHILVVIKPEGVPVQEDASEDSDLLNQLKAFIKVRDEKPGNVFLGLVHRLDRPVGGVMVFAKTSKAASRLSESMRMRTFVKVYHTIVSGKTPEEMELVDFLVKDNDSNMTGVVTKEVPGAKEARLKAVRLKYDEEDALSLLEIHLDTGRSHQIRVQFSSRDYPIVGDQRYGGRRAPNIALHAVSLSFPHPVKNETLTFASEPPKKFPWNAFFEKEFPKED